MWRGAPYIIMRRCRTAEQRAARSGRISLGFRMQQRTSLSCMTTGCCCPRSLCVSIRSTALVWQLWRWLTHSYLASASPQLSSCLVLIGCSRDCKDSKPSQMAIWYKADGWWETSGCWQADTLNVPSGVQIFSSCSCNELDVYILI